MRAIVYTWSSCSFCRRAKEMLERHGIEYREVVLDGKKDELRELQELFGARTMGELLARLRYLGWILCRIGRHWMPSEKFRNLAGDQVRALKMQKVADARNLRGFDPRERSVKDLVDFTPERLRFDT